MAEINSYNTNTIKQPSEEWYSRIKILLGKYSKLQTRALYSYCMMDLDVTDYPVFIAWLVTSVADKDALNILMYEYNEHDQLEENNFVQRRTFSTMGGAKFIYRANGFREIFTDMSVLLEANRIFKENLFPSDNIRCKYKNFDFNFNRLCSLYD